MLPTHELTSSLRSRGREYATVRHAIATVAICGACCAQPSELAEICHSAFRLPYIVAITNPWRVS
jgi:hypothetical protein